MSCICDARHNSESFKTHSQACDEYNNKKRNQELEEKIRWNNQKEPCSGSGYAHKAHGNCPGYTYDRT